MTQFVFRTPAGQNDFQGEPAKQTALIEQWNVNQDGFIQQGMAGNTWNSINMPPATNYFNPLDTPITPDAIVAPIIWQAFPGRINYYFGSQLTPQQILSLADTGYQSPQGPSFPNITKDPCSGETINKKYGPYGPRGWQDEYCEWAVTRNEQGKITRIDFTCENPEYWNSLWMIDPDKVVSLYQSTLNKPQITIDDLYLRDAEGAPVIDPSTGRPAYNPLNKWNSGPVSTPTAGGAMHLTSTPNTLQTETGLASSATVQRTVGNSDFNLLICCALYGQPHRNSDPNIGGTVNQVVSGNLTATLTNPPGLYIQMPEFRGYTTPDGTPASTFWNIVRGVENLNGDNGVQLPGNFILHAVFEVPESYGYTISDIKINGDNIIYGGQVTQTFNMQIVATAMSLAAPAPIACAGSLSPAFAQPLQLFYATVFNAMKAQTVANPVDFPMSLLSNSTLIAPIIKQGTSNAAMVLTCDSTTANPVDRSTWPTVTFEGQGDVKAEVTGVSPVTYAVPGNSYPGPYTALSISVSVTPTATKGLRGVFVTNVGQQQSVAMPALMNII